MKRLLATCIPRFLFARRLRRCAGDRILLTFDDGPHPDATPAVLRVLERYDARAMFFVIGTRIRRAPHMLRAIERSGHVLGNHSYAHSLESPMRYRDYLQDLRRCQEEIERYVTTPTRFHRPPKGVIRLATMMAPRRFGLRSVLWSRSSEDWRLQTDADAVACADRLAASIQARDIVLMHDEKLYTATLLERLLPALRARGLRFDPRIDDL